MARPLVDPELVGKVSLLTLASRQPSPQVRLLCDLLLDSFAPVPRGTPTIADIDPLDRDIG